MNNYDIFDAMSNETTLCTCAIYPKVQYGVNLLTENLKQEFIYMLGMNVIQLTDDSNGIFYSIQKNKTIFYFCVRFEKKPVDFSILIREANYAQK